MPSMTSKLMEYKQFYTMTYKITIFAIMRSFEGPKWSPKKKNYKQIPQLYFWTKKSDYLNHSWSAQLHFLKMCQNSNSLTKKELKHCVIENTCLIALRFSFHTFVIVFFVCFKSLPQPLAKFPNPHDDSKMTFLFFKFQPGGSNRERP